MIIFLLVTGYLIGSFPVAVLVGRSASVDPRIAGDSNAGWWNMRTLVGVKRARLVLVGDVFKGMIAAFLGLFFEQWWAPYISGFAAMVGHSFPAAARFRGGRSVLTFCGAVFIICWPAVVLALAIGYVSGKLRKRREFGLQMAMVAFPFCQFIFAPLTHVAATGVLMTFIGLRFAMASKSAPATSHSGAAST